MEGVWNRDGIDVSVGGVEQGWGRCKCRGCGTGME